jgi:dCMP deaminase
MGMAQLAAVRGTCSRLRVGAAAALDGRVLVTAYNGAPSGMPHCDHTCICTRPEVIHPMCPSHKPCTTAVHAEANLVAFSARHGISLLGTDIFTTDSPCVSCSQLLVNTGISRMVYAREYRDTSGLVLFEEVGILVERLEVIQWPN